jgi:hypothetical protein
MKNIVISMHSSTNRFTSTMFARIMILVLSMMAICDGTDLLRHLGRRHRLISRQEKLIPNPQGTLANLNNLDNKVSEWNSTLTLSNSTEPDAYPSATADLGATVHEIQNQSTQDMAGLSARLLAHGMTIDELRSDLTALSNETVRNISRINSLLADISDYAASAKSSATETIKSQLTNLQTQVNVLAGNSSSTQSVPSQLNEMGHSISDLEERVSALEGTDYAQTQLLAGESNSTTTVDYYGVDFLISSITGKVAIGGVALGLIALILASLALSKIPKASPGVERKEDDEQVLLEAGAVEEEGEAEAAGEEVYEYDPNAEYAEEQQQDQQQ